MHRIYVHHFEAGVTERNWVHRDKGIVTFGAGGRVLSIRKRAPWDKLELDQLCLSVYAYNLAISPPEIESVWLSYTFYECLV